MNTLDLYRSRGLEARRVSRNKGGEHHGPCPACGGEDRFHLWPEQGKNGSYWCRQCGKGGDAIQFLRDFEGMGFREACRMMGKETGGDTLPATPRPRRPRGVWRAEPAARPAEEWQAKAGKLVAWAHGHLLASPDRLAWLKARGIGPESVKAFRLGWNPGESGKDLWRPRAAWGLPEEINEKTGKPRRLWIPRGLVIPALDDAGAVLRVRVRRPEGEPRYYVLPGSSAAPLYLGHNRPAAVVVESELDALAVFAAAGDLAGAYAIGNSSAKPDAESAARLRGLAVILVATDFDEPDRRGQRAGEQAARWWLENFHQAERWPVPSGKDPGEAISAGLDLRAWVQAGLPPALAKAKKKPAGPSESRQALQEPPPRPALLEGSTRSGRPYVIIEHLEELAKYPGRVVFSWREIEALQGAGPDEGEAAALVKEVFPGANVKGWRWIS